VVNIEASESEKLPMLQKWIVSRNGKQAVANVVKCLGLALRGELWNNVSFSPHSVVCPLYNLTRCFSQSDLCLDESKVLSHISQLLLESQRFNHWQENMSVALKILENFANSWSSQRLMRGQCMHLLHSIASNNAANCSWFPPHPSSRDQVAMKSIRVNAEKILKMLSVMPISGKTSEKSWGCFNDQSFLLIITNFSVCMGQHERMGRSCWLMCLDGTLLQMIVQSALYE
jgi:hypothetical protein